MGKDFDGFSANAAAHYAQALRHGAQRVVIYADGEVIPLYGVLAFNSASPFSTGPDADAYRLAISDDDLTGARIADIAVADEKLDCDDKRNWWLGAVLWFCSVPLQSFPSPAFSG